VHVRILGINDLHGHLEPPVTGEQGAGGVAWLSSWLDRHSDAGRTIRVSAGDSAGGSPLISAHFHDEPAVETLNHMNFDVATAGNHEFDQGPEQMRRLSRLARFPYIGANSLDPRSGEPLLPPYTVVERAGVRIGFIGVTTRAGARWLLPEHAEHVRFADMSASVNRWVPALQARGVEAIVVLAHSGGVQETEQTASGEIVEETQEMSDAVDVVVAGHTHTLMNVRVGRKLVTQALSFGTAFDDIRLAIDPVGGDVVGADARIVRTLHAGVAPDPALERLVARYHDALGDLATKPVAELSEPLTRMPDDAGGTALGRLVAEAQRTTAQADIAFVNRDWIRSDLPAGPVTYSDLFEVQPFGNTLVRMKLKGAQVRELAASPLLESSGAPAVVDPGATYTVVANEFLASGGEDQSAFTTGTDRRRAGTDIEALVSYLRERDDLRARSR
jgi:5'-nucleotidase